MRIDQRLRRIEDQLGVQDTHRVFILWAGVENARDRARAEEARRNGWRIQLIIFCKIAVADTEKEAQEAIEAHKAEKPGMHCMIYRRDKPREVVLATWDPGLPEWLRPS
jgi:alkanesulfonate monooxygenase SsuD/methylene tetrahydromethanopterin reductase-like flavin-dependent oxidoreductase (luciferase family)